MFYHSHILLFYEEYKVRSPRPFVVRVKTRCNQSIFGVIRTWPIHLTISRFNREFQQGFTQDIPKIYTIFTQDLSRNKAIFGILPSKNLRKMYPWKVF